MLSLPDRLREMMCSTGAPRESADRRVLPALARWALAGTSNSQRTQRVAAVTDMLLQTPVYELRLEGQAQWRTVSLSAPLRDLLVSDLPHERALVQYMALAVGARCVPPASSREVGLLLLPHSGLYVSLTPIMTA